MKNDKIEKRVKRLIKKMEEDRGYLPAAWEYVVQKDVTFMEVCNKLYTCGLYDGKALPVKTRELIAIVLVAFRGNENGVYEHIKRALKHGATKQEILEALETSIIPGGFPTFATGIRGLMRIEEEEEKKTL